MTDLLVIVPSRGRPDRFRDFLAAWEATTESAELLVALDVDDPTIAHYPRSDVAHYEIGEPQGFAPRLNGEAMYATHPIIEAAVGVPWAIASLNDDHLPRTKGWDRLMVEALRDLGSGIVYGNDLLQYEALPTAPAITTDIVRALGFYCPPGLQHVYIDNFWLGLGIRLERLRYLPDVIIEHAHPQALNTDGSRKARTDATYELQTNAVQVADWNRWNAYRTSGDFDRDVERVRSTLWP